MNKLDSESYKTVFLDWIKDSTSHGLPRVFTAKHPILKALWFLVFFGGLGSALYYLYLILQTYFQYQPIVQVAFIQEFPTYFPAVTFCNLNPFVNLSGIQQSEIFNEASWNLNNVDYYFVEAEENLKRLVSNLTSSEQKDVGFKLNNETLVSCNFNKKICDSTSFTTFFDYKYGNCFTFNGDTNPFTTTEIGSDYGLTLEILTGDPKIGSKYSRNSGLFLVVHNQTNILVPSIRFANGISISPGYNTLVSVSRQFTTKLSFPFSNCLADSTHSIVLNNYMSDMNITTYDQASCTRLCYQIVVQNNCNCYDPKYPCVGSMKPKCLSNFQVQCILDITNSIFLKRNDYVNICGFDCPIQCNSIDYIISNSMAFYPSPYYVDILANKTNFLKNFNSSDKENLLSSVRKYLVRVTISYNELGYTLIQEFPSIDPATLVGNVGGQFGLFLGISILSIIEVFELMIDLMLITKKKYQVGKKKFLRNFTLVFFVFALLGSIIAIIFVRLLSVKKPNNVESVLTNDLIVLKNLQIQSSAEVYLPSSYKKKRDVQNCNQNEGKLVQACKNFSLSSCNEKGINYFINNYTDESMQLLKLSNESIFSGLNQISLIYMNNLTLETDLIKYKFSILLSYNSTAPPNPSNQTSTIAKIESNSLKNCNNVIKEANVTIDSIYLPIDRIFNITLNFNNFEKVFVQKALVKTSNSCLTSQLEFKNICYSSSKCDLIFLKIYLNNYISQSLKSISNSIKEIDETLLNALANLAIQSTNINFLMHLTFMFSNMPQIPLSEKTLGDSIQASLLNCENIFKSADISVIKNIENILTTTNNIREETPTSTNSRTATHISSVGASVSTAFVTSARTTSEYVEINESRPSSQTEFYSSQSKITYKYISSSTLTSKLPSQYSMLTNIFSSTISTFETISTDLNEISTRWAFTVSKKLNISTIKRSKFQDVISTKTIESYRNNSTQSSLNLTISFSKTSKIYFSSTNIHKITRNILSTGTTTTTTYLFFSIKTTLTSAKVFSMSLSSGTTHTFFSLSTTKTINIITITNKMASLYTRSKNATKLRTSIKTTTTATVFTPSSAKTILTLNTRIFSKLTTTELRIITYKISTTESSPITIQTSTSKNTESITSSISILAQTFSKLYHICYRTNTSYYSQKLNISVRCDNRYSSNKCHANSDCPNEFVCCQDTYGCNQCTLKCLKNPQLPKNCSYGIAIKNPNVGCVTYVCAEQPLGSSIILK